MTEDEIAGWHHLLYGHEFQQARGVGEGQGSWACCSPWGHKESDTTERLKGTELNPVLSVQFSSVAQSLSRVRLFATP